MFSIPRGTAKTYIDNCMGAGGAGAEGWGGLQGEGKGKQI